MRNEGISHHLQHCTDMELQSVMGPGIVMFQSFYEEGVWKDIFPPLLKKILCSICQKILIKKGELQYCCLTSFPMFKEPVGIPNCFKATHWYVVSFLTSFTILPAVYEW